MVSDFLSLDTTVTSIILLRSWRQAHQSPVIKTRIRGAVVEESTIEFRDHQNPTPFSLVASSIIALWG